MLELIECNVSKSSLFGWKAAWYKAHLKEHLKKPDPLYRTAFYYCLRQLDWLSTFSLNSLRVGLEITAVDKFGYTNKLTTSVFTRVGRDPVDQQFCVRLNQNSLLFALSKESIPVLVETLKSELSELFRELASEYNELIRTACPDVKNPDRIKESLLDDYDRLQPIDEFATAKSLPGVYFFATQTEPLYIGMSLNVKQRLTRHNLKPELKQIPDARFGVLYTKGSPKETVLAMEVKMIDWLAPLWDRPKQDGDKSEEKTARPEHLSVPVDDAVWESLQEIWSHLPIATGRGTLTLQLALQSLAQQLKLGSDVVPLISLPINLGNLVRSEDDDDL
ncbi:GIY-YIG nuclease family protein [Cyanobacteria bacterium FACHB-DQ100]|nr:GIY-YIG nuclease family protein [Cyanobacteria bacterium FACHB-DQ100]